MARANTHTILPLDRFAAICNMHPLHFNQVTVDIVAPVTTCDMPVVQYSWQTADKIGREEIATAIADAESIIKQYAGFNPGPDWIADERAQFDRTRWPEIYNANGRDVRGLRVSIRTGSGYVISGGIETKDLIDDNVAIVYSDADGDGYEETATITVNTTVTDTKEIALYYPGKDADNAWQIRPLKSVVINAGVATITCRREQLVLESLQEGLAANGVNGLDDANFLSLIDVYRKYNDPSQQIQMLWSPGTDCVCAGEGCASCTHATQYGCFLVREPRLGIIIPNPATWNVDDLSWSGTSFADFRAPDQARLWYYAGININQNMIPEWERAITYLALSMLDRPLCACRPLESFVAHWKEDLSYRQSSQSQSSSFNLSRKWLDNPIGTTRGALYAWQLIRKMMIEA